MLIEPLTIKTLESAVDLAEKCFPLDYSIDALRIRCAIEIAIFPEKYPSRFAGLLRPHGIHYWVAREEERVIGLVGYYLLMEDDTDSAWIAWYCVDITYRNKKIGLALLDFIIEKVRSLGKKYLKLFSSDIPTEHRAHQVYKKRGFVPFKNPEFDPKTKTTLIYLQLIL